MAGTRAMVTHARKVIRWQPRNKSATAGWRRIVRSGNIHRLTPGSIAWPHVGTGSRLRGVVPASIKQTHTTSDEPTASIHGTAPRCRPPGNRTPGLLASFRTRGYSHCHESRQIATRIEIAAAVLDRPGAAFRPPAGRGCDGRRGRHGIAVV